MQILNFCHSVSQVANGSKTAAIAGVVSSGNMEVLAERYLPPEKCEFVIHTPLTGYDEVWKMVLSDFVSQHNVGGLRFSINDSSARPDMVKLRLVQVLKMIGGENDEE